MLDFCVRNGLFFMAKTVFTKEGESWKIVVWQIILLGFTKIYVVDCCESTTIWGWSYGIRKHMLPVFKMQFKKILKLQKFG